MTLSMAGLVLILICLVVMASDGDDVLYGGSGADSLRFMGILAMTLSMAATGNDNDLSLGKRATTRSMAARAMTVRLFGAVRAMTPFMAGLALTPWMVVLGDDLLGVGGWVSGGSAMPIPFTAGWAMIRWT